MSTDIEFENAIETLLNRLTERMQAEVRETVSEIVAMAKTDRKTAVEAAREAAETRATQIQEEAETKIAAARAEAQTELERVRGENEAAMAQAAVDTARDRDEEIAKVREQAATDLASALTEAQWEAAEMVEGAKAAARAEAEKALTEEMNQVRADVSHGERAALAAVSRLLDSVRRIDAEPALSSVLDTLTELVAAEAGRVAVFVVQGGSVRGWRFAGFGPDAGEARDLVLDGAAGGFLARALAERRAVVLPAGVRSEEVGLPPGFASLPDTGQALAVPVLIGGEAMVLVYADDVHAEDRTILSQWCEAVELLARHAGDHLEALTAGRAAQLAGGSARFAVRPLPRASVSMAATLTSPAPPEPRPAPLPTPPPPAAPTPPPPPPLAPTPAPEPTAPPPPTPAPPPEPTPAPAPTPAPEQSPAAVAAPENPAPTSASPGADSEAEESAHRYARLLVSEIKFYNETALKEGREEKNIVERLRSEIDRARSLYEQRIPDTLQSRAQLFDQELVRTLADGDSSVLGN